MVEDKNNLATVSVGGNPIPAFEQQADGFLIPFKVKLPVQEYQKPLSGFKPAVQITLDRPLYALVGDKYVYCPTSMQWLNVSLVEDENADSGVKSIYFDVDSALFVHGKMQPTHFKDENGQYIDVNNRQNAFTDPDAPVVKFLVKVIFDRDNSDPGTAPV